MLGRNPPSLLILRLFSLSSVHPALRRLDFFRAYRWQLTKFAARPLVQECPGRHSGAVALGQRGGLLPPLSTSGQGQRPAVEPGT